MELRDKHGVEYADEKCLDLARQIKTLIDDTAVHADWLNNNNLKKVLARELTMLLYRNGYPPKWNKEVLDKVLDQVENFRTYN